MKRDKLMYVVSDIDKAMSFEWLAAELVQTYDLSFVLIGNTDTYLENFLRQYPIKVHLISDVTYSGNLRKWFRLFCLLRQEKPKIVHSHLWRATILSMSAAWLLGIEKRIFTRHHATIHYDRFPAGRKWDRLCNVMATDIVAVSNTIHTILIDWDKANVKKVSIAHHGFQLAEFGTVSEERMQAIRSKYEMSEKAYPVIGVIARYTSWKGIQYIVPAFCKLRKMYPSAFLVLANAHGDYKEEIKKQLSKMPMGSYREILFENDLPSLYAQMDVYVHAPVDKYVEAFGQTYVEALASGVPSVFTLSGVAPEFIVNEYNALVVPFKDSVAIENAIVRLLEDNNLRASLIENGKKSIDSFSFDKMADKLKKIYDS